MVLSAARCVSVSQMHPDKASTRIHFYPDDVNDLQTFLLNVDGSSSVENVKKIQIVFDKSSDFFGRVIIYHLEMFVE